MTDDHRELIEQARAEHQPFQLNGQTFCTGCTIGPGPWPCRPARLAEALEQQTERADNFRQQKLNLDVALREAWQQREDAKDRAAELAETLAASEEWRKAYQKGKHALYAMGGDVQQAAMAHLPCNEGGLDSRFTSLLEMPRLLAKDEQIAALTLRAEAAEADLQRYADLFERRGTQNAALARELAAARKAILSHHTIYHGLALWTCKECGGRGRGQQDIDHGPAGGTCWVAAAVADGKETP